MPQRRTELDEVVFNGPFGGIQSEMGLRQIEDAGFADVINILFYNGQLFPRPAVNPLPAIPAYTGPVLGIFDFYNYQGLRITGVFGNDGIWKWDNTTSTWHHVTGVPPLTVTSQLYSWTVVAGKMCFSQGTDPIQVWDGVSATFAPAAAGAVPAYHVGELGFHLISCPTVEAGQFAPQRIRWTGAGDPTDWTSFNSGQGDLFNDLGPINGWRKIYQQGYVFQQWGITQQILTGNGLVPFDFVPLQSKSKGLYYPYSIAGTGEFAIYGGKDEIYLFNGSASQPIADMPLQGRAWLGARSRILADLYTNGNPNNVYGHYTTSTNGREFEVYVLIIPSTSIWIYNMKEANWTRALITYFSGTGSTPLVCGSFFNSQATRIIDLVGTIASQSWTFLGLAGSVSPVDSLAFGGTLAEVYLEDFTGLPTTGCSLTTGSLAFGDTRHSKNVRHVRLTAEVNTSFDVTIVAKNEQGQTETETYVVNAAPGTTTYQVLPFHIPGVFITFTFTFNNTLDGDFKISELAIGYDMGAEVRTQ